MKTWIAVACALTLLATAALARQDKGKAPEAAAPAQELSEEARAAIVEAQRPSYPLATCAVSGEALGSMGDPIELVVEGRLVRLCCKGCTKAVQKEPAKFIAKVDEAVIAAQKPGYPLATCALSGEELGEDAVDLVVGTRLVRLCCQGCVRKVKKDATKVLATVDAALIEKQRASYPLEVCPVSGHPLAGEGTPVDLLYGVRLVRLCCADCKAPFKKDPKGFLAKIDAAAAAKRGN